MSDEPEGTPLRYSEIRGQIRDCDVFLFRGAQIISKLFQAGSHSKYSHSGLVGWWHDRVMLFQADLACVQTLPLSLAVRQYEGVVDWYTLRPEHRARADLDKILEEAKVNLGLPYATTDVLRTILHEVAGMELPDNCETPQALFCSQYVARCFRVGGIPLRDEPDMGVFPSEIAASPLLELKGTIVPDLTAEEARQTPDR